MGTISQLMIDRKVSELSDAQVLFNLGDNGGRRSGIDRRRFSYSDHIPERRSGEDRRSVSDRRSIKDRRSGTKRRNGESNVINIENFKNSKEQRSLKDRRSGMDRRDFMLL